MARIRTIKPELATHEGLYDLEIEAGLPVRFAWCMLFTVCDREGRFAWRPRALKAQVLPYDLIEFSRVLDAWLTRGFVVKYRVGNEWYGWIPTFTRHQVINNREVASSLPSTERADETIDNRDQQLAHASSTREARVDDASSTREAREGHAASGEGKGREGKGREGNVIGAPPLVPDGTGTADEFALNGSTANGHADFDAEIIAAYHELCPDLPRVKRWPERRRRKLNSRIKDSMREGKPADKIEYWRTFFEKVSASSFLCGRTGGSFRADLEWLLEPAHFERAIEGRYDNRSRARA